MSVAPEQMTAEEFLTLTSPDMRWAQLIEGEVVVNQPRFRHQDVTGSLYHRLRLWCDAGEGRRGTVGLSVDYRLDDLNVYAPDVWWRSAGDPVDRDAGHHPGVPDLAAEVRSPSTWRYDVGPKMATYERAGLPELWLVDTVAEVVLVYRRSAAHVPRFDVALEVDVDGTLTSPQLPDLALPIRNLFPV